MKGSIIEEKFEDRQLYIYLPENYDTFSLRYPVVYIHDGDEMVKFKKEFFQKVEENGLEFIGVMIVPKNRFDEYTPWYSEALNSKYPDFQGKGDEYLDFIVNKIKPFIDVKYNTKIGVEDTCIMGASLGGIISIYGLIAYPETFGKVISISGSFWYKDMLSFLENTNMNLKDKKIFLSVGDNEDKHKVSPETSMIESNLDAYKILKSKELGDNLHFELDEHSKHSMACFIPNFVDGLVWILK